MKLHQQEIDIPIGIFRLDSHCILDSIHDLAKVVFYPKLYVSAEDAQTQAVFLTVLYSDYQQSMVDLGLL